MIQALISQQGRDITEQGLRNHLMNNPITINTSFLVLLCSNQIPVRLLLTFRLIWVQPGRVIEIQDYGIKESIWWVYSVSL